MCLADGDNVEPQGPVRDIAGAKPLCASLSREAQAAGTDRMCSELCHGSYTTCTLHKFECIAMQCFYAFRTAVMVEAVCYKHEVFAPTSAFSVNPNLCSPVLRRSVWSC